MKPPAKQPLFMTQMTHSHGKLGPSRESLCPLVGPKQQFYSTTCCNERFVEPQCGSLLRVSVCVCVCVCMCVQYPPPAVCSPSLPPPLTSLPLFHLSLLISFANPNTTVGYQDKTNPNTTSVWRFVDLVSLCITIT
jgi:hypothetical protein